MFVILFTSVTQAKGGGLILSVVSWGTGRHGGEGIAAGAAFSCGWGARSHLGATEQIWK